MLNVGFFLTWSYSYLTRSHLRYIDYSTSLFYWLSLWLIKSIHSLHISRYWILNKTSLGSYYLTACSLRNILSSLFRISWLDLIMRNLWIGPSLHHLLLLLRLRWIILWNDLCELYYFLFLFMY